MPLRSNTELKTSIAAYLKRSDLTTTIPDFIRLAERRITRMLTRNGMEHALEVSKTVTAAASTQLPSRTIGIPRVVYLDKNPKKVLDYVNPDEFYRMWGSTETGEPVMYTIVDHHIVMGPAPDSAYDTVIIYRQAPDAASTVDQRLIGGHNQDDYDGSPATEGSFSGGTGHAVGDVITLSDGSEVTVYAVSGGVVTEFEITHASWDDVINDGDTLTQSSTTGSGASFSLTVGVDDIGPVVLQEYPELYLYGSLVEGFTYLRNDKELQRYDSLFMQALDQIHESNFHSAGTLQMHLDNE